MVNVGWHACKPGGVGYLQEVGRRCLGRTGIEMSEKTPLVRQWMLLRALSARHYGATVKEMALEMGVSEKTIRRDLETFQTAGFPLEEITCERGLKKWRIDPAKTQPALTFAFDEAVALYLSRRLMEPLAGTPFWDASQRAFKKIRASLGAEALKYIDRFAGMFCQTMVGTSDYSKKAEIIDELMLGIEDRKAVFITYQSLQATEAVTYDIYPLGLVYHRGSLYLVGWAPEHEEIRHWKVNRIEDAEVTEFPFQCPEGFDLRDHLARSFGVYQGDGEGDFCVKVRFSPQVARYVSESTWHASQQLTAQKDGSLLAEFRLGTTEEVKRWLLGFGRHAVVLEPEELREEIVEELKALLSSYADEGAKLRPEGI